MAGQRDYCSRMGRHRNRTGPRWAFNFQNASKWLQCYWTLPGHFRNVFWPILWCFFFRAWIERWEECAKVITGHFVTGWRVFAIKDITADGFIADIGGLTLHTDPYIWARLKQRSIRTIQTTKLELSENITLTTGSYQGEKRTRMKNVIHSEKNISFSRPEWAFLMGLLDQINTFLLSLDKSKTAEKTWTYSRSREATKE